MKSKRIYFVSLFAFVVMLMLGSCSPLVLKQSSVLNGAALYEYKTFTITQPRTMSLPKGVKQSDIDRLYAAISKEMKNRGYSEAKGRADLVVSVSYQVKLSKEVSSTTMGSRTGVRTGGGVGTGVRGGGGVMVSGSRMVDTSVSAETVRDGIVIMDISSRMDNEHLYYSQLKVDLSSNALFLRDNELLSKATDKLFKKFPIK
ncbi:MAG: DUF4136 domain-containing protein [Rikenellaceae bacterium]